MFKLNVFNVSVVGIQISVCFCGVDSIIKTPISGEPNDFLIVRSYARLEATFATTSIATTATSTSIGSADQTPEKSTEESTERVQ